MPGTRQWISKPWPGQRLSSRNTLGQGLRGVWAFNEGSGLSVFNPAQANTAGTLSGATPPSWASSLYGSALTFNGSTSYIASVGTVDQFGFLSNPAVFTIAARIRLANPSADAAGWILGGSATSSVRDCNFWYENRSIVSSPKALRCLVGTGTVGIFVTNEQSSSNAITDSLWHHVVVTVSGTTATKFYVDGVPLSSTSSGTIGAPSGTMATTPDIGRVVTGSFYFSGDMEHVMVWDRVLSADEVRNLYGNPYQVFPSRYRRTPLASTTTYFLWNSEVEDSFNVLTY